MRLPIERKRLVKMLESVQRKLPGQKKKDKEVRLSACAARVFVEANGTGRHGRGSEVVDATQGSR